MSVALHPQQLPINRPPGRYGLFDEDSDDDFSEDGSSPIGTLMVSSGPEAALLSEMSSERQIMSVDQIRTQKLDFEMKALALIRNFGINLSRTQKVDLEMVSKLEKYKRGIAEAVDGYLIDLRRDFEHEFGIEERKIRDDAEKLSELAQAEREEKLLQQQKTAEREEKLLLQQKTAQKKKEGAQKKKQDASETALELERIRMKMYEELCAKNTALNLDCAALKREIKRSVRTMQGMENNVRERAEYLVNLINHSGFPQSIGIAMFVDTIVAQFDKPTNNRQIYAYAKAVVFVSSTLPQVMDMLVAKLNKVCIYTVPKHIPHSNSAFETRDAYFRAIGFRQEEDGKIESADSFLEFMASCMMLYGAIVQTEVRGFQNHHGLEHGWAWLARFLNALPPNLYTTVALHSFMKMAGYEMHRRFGHQFAKMVCLCRKFLEDLPEDVKSSQQVLEFRDYLESNQFMKEPEERVAQGELASSLILM